MRDSSAVGLAIVGWIVIVVALGWLLTTFRKEGQALLGGFNNSITHGSSVDIPMGDTKEDIAWKMQLGVQKGFGQHCCGC